MGACINIPVKFMVNDLLYRQGSGRLPHGLGSIPSAGTILIMTKYWLSCSRFTIQVNTDDNGIIVWTAPIARKFVGQPLQNLVRWSKADQVLLLPLSSEEEHPAYIRKVEIS